MKLLLLLLLAPALTLAQRIPDAALRRTLARQGFITNGQLNAKARKWDQLYIEGADIKSLEGIQHFVNVRFLTIYRTKLERLDYMPPRVESLTCSKNALTELPALPPMLTHLSCDDNRLTRLPTLPARLTHLTCADNRLTQLPTLPAGLTYLNFSNNRLVALPVLPPALTYLNYFGNPLPPSRLPPVFATMTCSDGKQNCLPNPLRNWHILNARIQDTAFIPTRLQVTLTYNHAWGGGVETKQVVFRPLGAYLVADSAQVRKFGRPAGRGRPDTTYIEPLREMVSQRFLRQLVADISRQKMVFRLRFGDTARVLDLTRQRMELETTMGCIDCSDATIRYVLVNDSASVSLNYSANGMVSGSPFAYGGTKFIVTPILDWLYMYQLVRATMPAEPYLQRVFRESGLRKLVKWAEGI